MADYLRCCDRALANHKVVTDAFRSIYPINAGIPEGKAPAIGRYPEDVYYGGQAWYLTSLAAAEQLYDALYTWNKLGSITVTSTSLPFFHDLDPSITTGSYSSTSSAYSTLYNAVRAYADEFIDIVATYAHPNGSLAEQFHRADGTPLSAFDLTWSYAAFLTAVARRDGIVPYSWGAPCNSDIPSTCYPDSATGTYSTASTTSWPASQPPSSSPTGSSACTTTTTSTCATPTAVAVTFTERVTTDYGQDIKLVGSIPKLGNWDPKQAIPLSASKYTDSRPVWFVTVDLPPGEVVQYKFIKVAGDGSVSWEADPNHTFTVPACVESAVVDGRWQETHSEL